MKIYFARHGESQANVLHIISNRDLPHSLTEMGRQQARRLAERLRAKPIVRIYSSPIRRAVETAGILAAELKVDIELADGLREFDCGIAEGRSDEPAWQLWQTEYEAWVYNHDYEHQIEGGESFEQVRQRFVPFIEGLVERHSPLDQSVVCISHGGLYSVMFPWVMKNVTAAMVMKYRFDYSSCIVAEQQQGGLECIEWNGEPISHGDLIQRT